MTRQRIRVLLIFLSYLCVQGTGQVALAQVTKKVPWVGLSRVDSPPRKPVDDFRQGLRDLGYVEGQNLALEIRWAGSNMEQLNEVAAGCGRSSARYVSLSVSH